MTIAIEDGNIVFSCRGAEFISVQAKLIKALGAKCKIVREGIIVPLRCADAVLEQFPDIKVLRGYGEEIEAHKHAVVEANNDFEELRTSRVSPEWIDILDIPQQYAVNAIVCPGLRGACLFDEQGTGKTVMAISAFDIMMGASIVEQAVIVSPKSMLGSWESDIRKFTAEKYSVGIVEGASEQKRRIVGQKNAITIVNYEGIANVLVPIKTAARQSRTMLIVDESYYAKNPATLRAKLLAEIRPLCVKCLVLCGTPAPRSPYDIIGQVNLADNGFAFSTFTKGASEEEDRSRVADILHARALTIRRLKQEVLPGIPEKNFEIIRVALTGRQKYMYEKARDELVVELRALDNTWFKKHLATYFQKRAALLEICAAPKMVDRFFTGESAKLKRLVTLVDALAGEKRKVLIWTCYRESVSEIAEALVRYAPLVLDGSVSDGNTRTSLVKQFQTDPDTLVMIANPAAAGAGITLHASYDAIYYSYTNQAAHYLQSLDRIHRRGQTAKTVNYYMMICEGTIEEYEVRRLRQRELAQHDLLGDVIEWPESLDKELAELTNTAETL